MKITIESTDMLFEIDGNLHRLWEGTTERGVKCHVFVHAVAVHAAEDQQSFERELIEVPARAPVFVRAEPPAEDVPIPYALSLN